MDFPTVRELARRRSAVRILKFLKNSEEPLNFTDIYTTLDANDCTILYWLKRLVRFGILKGVRSRANLHSTYYSIGDKEGAEWIIERYHWNVGFKLARLIPYEETEESKVRDDRRFKAMCEENYLSISEGISAVLSCPKISSETHSGRLVLWRKEQGYDVDILEEAKKAIG